MATSGVTAVKPLAIAIMGPTASGKTDLAIGLHQALGAPIISADSALIYQGMDIGTAKPSAEELAKAPHALINIKDPAQRYSAAEFARDATELIEVAVDQGKTPVVVGGTMLYFKALLEGLADIPASTPEVRKKVEQEATQIGWPAMHAELVKVDPVLAAKLHPNHSQRIGRAIEVYRMTGKPLSAWQAQATCGLLQRYRWIQIAISPTDRSVLHQRIAQRFDLMLNNGLIEEVKALYARKDLNPDMPAIRAVGYRQVWEYLEGQVDYNTMRDKGIAATRQLAKRQLTWLRSWHDLSWVNTLDSNGQTRNSDEILVKALELVRQSTL